MNHDINLKAFYAIARRRKWHVLLPAVLLVCVGLAVTMTIPPTYRSKAMILIEDQEIPQELIQTTVTGFVEERLQTITQVVLNRKNLLSVIEKFNLYSEMSDKKTVEEILEVMRDDIAMQPIQTEVSDMGRGRPGMATIAFSMSYEGHDPRKVLQTTEMLVSLFLEENLKEREQKARLTSDFLEKQVEQGNEEIQALEAEIAQFKEKNMHSLPELMGLNIQTLDQLRKEMDSRREMGKSLMDRKIYLEGQLASVDPVRPGFTADGRAVLSPEDELRSVRSQYLSLKAAKSEKHPDVIRLKQQLAVLEGEVSGTSAVLDAQRELRAKQSQLDAAQAKYTDKHPDVLRLKQEVKDLRAQVASLKGKRPALVSSGHADNPAYVALKTQIRSTELDIQNNREVTRQLQEKYEDYMRRVELTPRVEQEYRQLQRNYANLQSKYQENLQKLMLAKESAALEKERVGERLTLIDPPTLPEKPHKPDRLLLTLVTIVLSAGVGLAIGAFAEFMDTSVHAPDDLNAMGYGVVLSQLPHVQTQEEHRIVMIRKVSMAIGAVAVFVLALLALHHFVMPLDVFWFKVVGKLIPA